MASPRFELHTPSTGHKKKDVPTEYVILPRGGGLDEVYRKATDADRAEHKHAYAAFKASLVTQKR